MSAAPKPDPVHGAIAGLAGGLAASLAMDLFQKAVGAFSSDDGAGGEPATEQAADGVARAATGGELPDDVRPIAGQAVHYGFGALLGLAYGVAAEYWPRATIGGGTAFGVASALLFDEAAVPAAGLGSPPWEAPASSHAYSLGSHLVFGAAAEAIRRLVRGGR